MFLGGGSVLIAMLQNIKENRIKINGTINAYNINETLINLYKNIQLKPTEILFEIKKIIDIYAVLDGNFTNEKFTTKIISCKRSINSKKPGSKINEVLIKSY